MPKYSFECPNCTVRFERNLRVGIHTMHDCPSCHEPAPLIMEGFGFAFAEGKPTNSGVHGQDYPTADQAVGRSATSRWGELKERDLVKKAAREHSGTQALIRHTGKDYIDYEPMSDVGRVARRKLTRHAFKVTKEAKS